MAAGRGGLFAYCVVTAVHGVHGLWRRGDRADGLCLCRATLRGRCSGVESGGWRRWRCLLALWLVSPIKCAGPGAESLSERARGEVLRCHVLSSPVQSSAASPFVKSP